MSDPTSTTPNNPTLWTTPFELTKSKKTATRSGSYLTPLPSLAQRLIKGLLKQTTSDQLFPGLPVRSTKGGRPSFHGEHLQRRLVAHAAPKDLAFHTWRHTVATWLEDAGLSEWNAAWRSTIPAAAVTAGYSHGYPLELKLKLLTKWADHVEQLVQPEARRCCA